MKLKVGQVSESFHSCGVLEVILGIISHLLGTDISLLGPQCPRTKDLPGIFIPSVKLPGKREYYCTFPMAIVFLGRIKKFLASVDIAVLHSLSFLTLFTMLVARLMRNRPKIIYHAHTQNDEYIRSMLGWFPPLAFLATEFVNFLEKYFLCNPADLVLVPSEKMTELIQKRLNLKVRPTVWSAPFEIPENLPEAGIDFAGKPTLIYVGRLGEEKRISRLLKVFGVMYNRMPFLHLILIGGGDIAKYRKIASKLPKGAGKEVEFLGNIPHLMVLAICKKATDENTRAIGISDSDTEAQGLGIYEQMSVGLTVAIPCQTCWEKDILASEGGVLLTGDPEKDADLLFKLLYDDKTRIIAGNKAKEYIAMHYSCDVKYKELAQIYERVIQS